MNTTYNWTPYCFWVPLLCNLILILGLPRYMVLMLLLESRAQHTESCNIHVTSIYDLISDKKRRSKWVLILLKIVWSCSTEFCNSEIEVSFSATSDWRVWIVNSSWWSLVKVSPSSSRLSRLLPPTHRNRQNKQMAGSSITIVHRIWPHHLHADW